MKCTLHINPVGYEATHSSIDAAIADARNWAHNSDDRNGAVALLSLEKRLREEGYCQLRDQKYHLITSE